MALYFPSFSSRPFELLAYEMLSDSVKDSICPVVTLTRQSRATSFGPSLAAVLEAANGRRVVVDFDPNPKTETSAQEAAENRRRKQERRRRDGKDPTREPTDKELAHWARLREESAAFNADLARMLSPTGSPLWIRNVLEFPQAVPIIRVSPTEEVVAQVAVANELDRPVAFRVTPDLLSVNTAIDGMRALRDPKGSLIFIEGEHVRGQVDMTVRRVDGTLRGLRRQAGSIFDAIECIVVSGSFPANSLRDLPRTLAIEEHAVFDAIAKDWSVSYGDHASIQKRSEQAGGSGWFPHVDLALQSEWKIDLTEKNRDKNAYVAGSARIVDSESWKQRIDCWGTEAIRKAAEGSLIQDDVKFTHPSPWIGVRANQHMTQQASRV